MLLFVKPVPSFYDMMLEPLFDPLLAAGSGGIGTYLSKAKSEKADSSLRSTSDVKSQCSLIEASKDSKALFLREFVFCRVVRSIHWH
jgi:hypothetical protein